MRELISDVRAEMWSERQVIWRSEAGLFQAGRTETALALSAWRTARKLLQVERSEMKIKSERRKGQAAPGLLWKSHGRPLEGSALRQKVPWLPGAWRQEGAPMGSTRRSMATGRETPAVVEVGDEAVRLWRLTPVSSPLFRRVNTQVCDLTNWVDSSGSSKEDLKSDQLARGKVHYSRGCLGPSLFFSCRLSCSNPCCLFLHSFTQEMSGTSNVWQYCSECGGYSSECRRKGAASQGTCMCTAAFQVLCRDTDTKI